jgi:putative ABC transport system permease protein
VDLRYSIRTLARTPGFTAIAVVTLALGIGANTAIFSLVHAVILKPLPFRDPSRLVAIWDTYLPQYDKLGVSPPEIAAWKQQSDLFEQTAWYRYVPKDLNLNTPGMEALEVHATCASDRLFPLLGVRAAVGRTFAASEDPHAVILSHELWQRRFGGNPAIVGSTLRLNEQAFTIIGVMPSNFQFPDWADLWVTEAQIGDEMTNPVRHAVGFVARLRPGANLRQVSARAAVISRRLASEHPKTSQGWGMNVAGLQDDLTAKVRPALLMLLGAVAMILLIACANVANLLLSRASGRAKEMAVRIALGAGIWRLVRQLLVESMVLAVLGGGLGLILADWALALAPMPAPLDSAVLLFLAGISITTGVVFGLVPASHALKSDPSAVIKAGSMIGGGSKNVRATLVVVEFALAVVLLAGAGILMKSFLRLMKVDPGFNPHKLLSLRITLPPSKNADAVFHRIEERVRTLPGVESIATSNTLPLAGKLSNTSRFNVPGSSSINPDALPAAFTHTASPDLFTTLQIPLRSGRVFTERDLNQPVVIINETMARRFWAGKDAVGQKYITGPWGPNPTWSTIVGVVGDVKQAGLDAEPSMDEYFPSLYVQYLVIRTAGDPSSLAGTVRRQIHAIDADLPISDVQTMDEVVSESARSRRWTMGLLAAFAGLALVLALVGIYGVMSWSVAQRTREIGIRMALGAQSGEVLAMVLRYALRLTTIGLAIGVAGGLALRRVLSTLVFDVSTADPFIYAGAVLLMLAAALLACYVPARRASRADPLVALRWE